MDLQRALLISGILRFVLVVYGDWQDKNLEVPFTDIDYEVFTDAARFTASGGSPYSRSTYRYTPLLAYLMLGNIWWHPAWGKVIFSLADLLVGKVIHKLVLESGHCSHSATRSAMLWLFNPFTFTISTRGSSDALVALILLAVLMCVQKDQNVVAGALWGFAVHWRVFPVIYGPSILVLLAVRSSDRHIVGKVSKMRKVMSHTLSIRCASFILSSAIVFFGLGAIFYYAYGFEFLQETYLHHLSRRDPRHNFSLYFYHIYLHEHAAEFLPSLNWMPDVAAFAFGPPAILMLLASWKLSDHLPLCWLIITMIFVAFNKVCTAQYFIWYFCMFPVVAPQMSWPPSKPLVLSFTFWLATQMNWLAWAYLLEFKGLSTYPVLWASSCVFLVANITLMNSLLTSCASQQQAHAQDCVPKQKQT